MRFAIIYSKLDPAGINIINQLNKSSFTPHFPIIELEKETIYSDNINDKTYPELRNIDFLVFASKHQSEKKEKALCIHAPGNFRSADFGGKTGKVCKTSAFVLKYLFKNLNENAKNIDYKITMEATHHGPLIDFPCCFIELGSSEEQWNDESIAKIIAETILTLENFDKFDFKEYIPCLAIGGPHYCPNFNKIQLSSNYAISHVIAEYNLPLTETILIEAEKNTLEQIKEILIDWKGCGNSEERNKLIEVLKKYGIKFRRTSGIVKE
jgi:D-aminoacyl-tRNA deacylase